MREEKKKVKSTSFILNTNQITLASLLHFSYSISSQLYTSFFCLSLSYASLLVQNNVPVVKPPPNHTSSPFMAATLLTTRLKVVLQPSGYSVFHGGDTPIQLSLPWRSYSCQCLNTEISAWAIGVFPLKPRASLIILVCI